MTNSLATLQPDLAAQWHPTKNGALTPDMVVAGLAGRPADNAFALVPAHIGQQPILANTWAVEKKEAHEAQMLPEGIRPENGGAVCMGTTVCQHCRTSACR